MSTKADPKNIVNSAHEAVLAGKPITANPYLNQGNYALDWEMEYLRCKSDPKRLNRQ